MFNPLRPLTHAARHAAGKAGFGAGFNAAASLPHFGGGGGMFPSLPSAAPRPSPRTAAPVGPPETNTIMAALELWTIGPNGQWAQRTDSVRLYPLALFQQYRDESIIAIQHMRPAVLRLWTLDRATGKWNVEVHNAS